MLLLVTGGLLVGLMTLVRQAQPMGNSNSLIFFSMTATVFEAAAEVLAAEGSFTVSSAEATSVARSFELPISSREMVKVSTLKSSATATASPAVQTCTCFLYQPVARSIPSLNQASSFLRASSISLAPLKRHCRMGCTP